MDYDLVRLGSHEFEHLTQALCIAALGARVSVFGNGPDGGREATVEGRVAWSNSQDTNPADEQWDGYTVVQAKFRLRPEGVESNLSWLLRELQKELSRWTDSRFRRSKTKKPENLLIVTNVPLSAATGGGIDAANKEIASLIEKHDLNLQGWRLWHYDDICSLLDVHRSVRITYGGYLTTGDILSQINDWLDRERSDLTAALTAHLVKDMLAQQYVRLGQAGDLNEDKLALDKISIDLPGVAIEWLPFKEAMGIPDAEVTVSESGGPNPSMCEVARNVQAARYVIDCAERVGTPNNSNEGPAHLLLVGGPGQGKSTLAQMICQAYRVNLLENASLTGEATRLRKRLINHFAEIELPSPKCRRWPIRVVLSDYSDYLGRNPGHSLLRFLSEKVSLAGAFDISSQDMRSWLGEWPWLLVLDGMDEVVSPTSREQVTSGVSDFLVDAAQLDADVLIVVTTRPQGYTGEFGAEDYQRISLSDLDRETATGYARRLTEVRLGEDPDLRQQVDDRVQHASEQTETARLMRTPLQVTIMTLLLERRQRAPHDRYQLFNAFFDAIYARETNKPGDLGRLLDEYRADIEAIHESIALELQQKAELTPEHEEAIPITDLERHALDRLVSEGNPDDRAILLAEKINRAATHRLVLLVPHGNDGVGFEVRSLQEYMAARALTRGEGFEILARLRPLAASAHWRNTWLLASGRLFRERESLREPLINLILKIDNESLLSWLVRAGAELATELLADDLAIRSPQFRRLLADQVMDRINNLPDATWRDLGNTLQELAESDQLIRRKLDQHISSALATGGGPRAHALLMLGQWAKATGGLAAKSRQLRSQYAGLPVVEDVGLHMVDSAVHSRRRLRDLRKMGFQVQDGPSLVQYLDPHLSSASDSAATPIRKILETIPRDKLHVCTMGDLRAHLVPFTVKYKSQDVMQLPFERPDVADAYAVLVDALPKEDWHVAVFLREIGRFWFARNVVSH